MTEKRFTDSWLFQTLCVSMLLLLVIASLMYFKDLLKPLALGILLWYLIKAFNGLIEKVKFRGKPLNIWVRRFIALLIILGILQGSVAIFISNVKQIISNYSSYESDFNLLVAQTGQRFGITNVTDWLEQRTGELDIRGFLTNVLSSATTLVGNLFLVLIYSIFLFIEENTFAKKMSLIYNKAEQLENVNRLMNEIYHFTNKYVAVKAFVSIITAALSYVVLIIVGVDFAFLWSLLIFALNFIPYIGSIIATLLPAAFSILQFGALWPAFWVFVSIIVIQNIIGNYVEPKIMGKSLNISPLVVIITLAFWGYVWDLLGMLLAVPITSIIIITLAQFPATKGIAILMTENGDIENLRKPGLDSN